MVVNTIKSKQKIESIYFSVNIILQELNTTVEKPKQLKKQVYEENQ